MKKFLTSLAVILTFSALSPAALAKETPIGRLFGGKVLVGSLVNVDNKTINVTQADGTLVPVVTTEITKQLKGGRPANLKSLRPGDQIFVLGADAGDGTFLAKSLVAKAKILKALKKESYFGSVVQVADASFTVKDLIKGGVLEITLNDQTRLRRNGKKVLLPSLKPLQRVVIIALKEDDGSLTGEMVVLLPEKPSPSEASPE